MSDVVLKVENVSKQYRLGQFGTGSLNEDFKRWSYRIRGKEDPFLKVGEENDRTTKGQKYVWALKNLNFGVNKGEVIGIIGKNGAGKSTLLKILSQVTTPTTGRMGIKGRIASLLEVGTGFHPELTGKENIYLNGAILGMKKREIKTKFDEIVEFSGCAKYIDTPVKRYSSGMLVRLGFAVAAHLEAEILVIDEVLAVGDQEFQDKCIGKMKDVSQSGRTVLFVSHNMASIQSLCPKCILLDKGQLKIYDNTKTVITEYKQSVINQSLEGETIDIKPSYKSPAGSINKVSLKNSNDDSTGIFMFEEDIIVNIEITLTNKVKEPIIEARLVSSDGILLAHFSTSFFNSIKSLNPGSHTIQFKFTNTLQSGIYSFDIGIHYPNFSTIFAAKDVISFKVENLNFDSSRKLNFDRSLGYLRPETKWKII